MISAPVGILALQGAFARHAAAVEALGRTARLVRTPGDLSGLGGLILPGGESTAIGKLMVKSGLLETVKAAVAAGLPLFGTCAGLILLASEVVGPPVSGLCLIDARVERNGYGRQRESFRTPLKIERAFLPEDGAPLEGVFIRAPRILKVGPSVEILARRDSEAVLLRQGSILAGTFHPELTEDLRIHRYFLEEVC